VVILKNYRYVLFKYYRLYILYTILLYILYIYIYICIYVDKSKYSFKYALPLTLWYVFCCAVVTYKSLHFLKLIWHTYCADDDRFTSRSIDSIPGLIDLNEHCGKDTNSLSSANFWLTEVNMWFFTFIISHILLL